MLISIDQEDEIESRWVKALQYFKKRKSVVFINDQCRFWESHGFVQQSLARTLVSSGIDVTWIDGSGWRKYKPTLSWDSPYLTVEQLFSLPGRKVSWIDTLNSQLQADALKKLVQNKGKPIIWVQSSLDDRIASALPYIDIYSVFDDPYRQHIKGSLCQKAKMITCQNSFATSHFQKHYEGKTFLFLPPVEMDGVLLKNAKKPALPRDFPKKIMGYIGSFMSAGFDLVLFENFIRTFPDWGFILMGRTDATGNAILNDWKKYPNFLNIPWAPREQAAGAWNLLDVSLLLYRPHPPTEGAFPVKLLEALYFNVPSVATQVAKTSSLEGYIPRSSFPDRLKTLALNSVGSHPHSLNPLYRHFAYEMNPKLHLARAAEYLKET